MADLENLLGGALAALFSVAFAVALLRLGLAGFATAAPQDAEAVPILRLLALGAGIVLGLALVAAGTTGAFTPERVLGRGGPWNIGLTQLLERHALPSRDLLRRLATTTLRFDGLAGLFGWAGLLGLLQGAAMTRRLWQGKDARRAFVAFLLLTLHVALLLHWSLHLAVWLAAQLHVWLLAIALLLFQRWRYRPRPMH